MDQYVHEYHAMALSLIEKSIKKIPKDDISCNNPFIYLTAITELIARGKIAMVFRCNDTSAPLESWLATSELIIATAKYYQHRTHLSVSVGDFMSDLSSILRLTGSVFTVLTE